MIWKKRKGDVIDLTDYYRKQQERTESIKESLSSPSEIKEEPSSQETSGGMFGFFSAVGNSQKEEPETTEYVDLSEENKSYESPEEKKKRFAKRIADMTTQLENLSNQVYKLQQRIDILERKSGGEY